MALFIKKEEEQQQEQTEKIITELKEEGQTTPEPMPEQKPVPEQKIKFKIAEEQPKKNLPQGTITAKIIADGIELATFTITPEIFKPASIMLKDVISKIENPRFKLTTNCDCIWCKEKTTELEKFLKS